RKVGYLFGSLYIISPVIWMIPPMLYKVVNPNLSGLENEGAYLLMCQEVLPVGMLGLMLGGMIFATASSVNTSLNLSAAVLTNDIYKQLRPGASDKNLMVAARLFTLLFGLGTIGVALLVPAAGGIVEVVLSIGAVTGASLYGPPVWALFSKRHTGKSILYITLLSLAVNIFFKTISPWLLNIRLDRAQEMIMGVAIPLLLLIGYELYGFLKNKVSIQHLNYAKYKALMEQVNPADKPLEQDSARQNTYGIKVIGFSLGLIGVLMAGIILIAQKGILLLVIMSILIFTTGILLWHYAHKSALRNNQNKKRESLNTQ
ncbi:MAG: sodium:solute symporter family transporter, partial [Cyclobacteriaceae bacterium]